jgi:hypothetical protein
MGEKSGPVRRVAPWASVVALMLLAAACAGIPRVSVPHGWKPVSYGGLTIDVPPSWSVYQRSQQTCGIPGPGVLLGPPIPPHRILACTGIIRRGVVLTFGGPDIVVPVGRETRKTINGVQVAVSELRLFPGVGSGASTEEVVRLPGHDVWLEALAPGWPSTGALTVVSEVVGTVRAAA